MRGRIAVQRGIVSAVAPLAPPAEQPAVWPASAGCARGGSQRGKHPNARGPVMHRWRFILPRNGCGVVGPACRSRA